MGTRKEIGLPSGVYVRTKPVVYPRRRVRPLAERFWSKVQKSDGCWLWTGALNGNGYGRIGLGRRGEPTVMAHRVSYEINVGPVPDDRQINHHCDVRNCVRPDHLFLGDHQINADDMMAKGRHRTNPSPGEQNGVAKLSNAQVLAIRSRSVNERQAALAREFGVTRQLVWQIVRGRAWRHLQNTKLGDGEACQVADAVGT